MLEITSNLLPLIKQKHYVWWYDTIQKYLSELLKKGPCTNTIKLAKFGIYNTFCIKKYISKF